MLTERAPCGRIEYLPGSSFRHEPTGWSADVDAVLAGQAGEPLRVAVADRREGPVGAVADDLAEDDERLQRRLHVEVVADELRAVLVGGVDVRVVDLAEVLTALDGLVDVDGEDDLLGVRRQRGEVHQELLVVALGVAGEVVTGVLHRAVRRLEVAEEDEVRVVEDPSGLVDHERHGVEVEFVPGGERRLGVPAEADRELGERRAGDLAEVGLLTLDEGNGHGSLAFDAWR